MTATTKFVLCHTRQHLNLAVVTYSFNYDAVIRLELAILNKRFTII